MLKLRLEFMTLSILLYRLGNPYFTNDNTVFQKSNYENVHNVVAAAVHRLHSLIEGTKNVVFLTATFVVCTFFGICGIKLFEFSKSLLIWQN